MVDISKHPILNECCEVMQAIEECGCSLELTNAVTKAGDLLGSIDRLVIGREKLIDAVKAAYRKHHMGDNSIGWDELSAMLHDALCRELGDGGFCAWADTVEPLP